MTQQLIRRDLPLEPGRRLRFTFTIAYEVPLDDDVLWTEGGATLDDLEQRLAGDKYGSSERLWRTLHDEYDRNVIEHETTLADIRHTLEDAPIPGLPFDPPRFEVAWEQRERERGNQAAWPSRVWLEAIPAPNVGASA